MAMYNEEGRTVIEAVVKDILGTMATVTIERGYRGSKFYRIYVCSLPVAAVDNDFPVKMKDGAARDKFRGEALADVKRSIQQSEDRIASLTSYVDRLKTFVSVHPYG